MSTIDSRWLGAIDKVSWWVLAGVAAGCWITFGFHTYEFLIMPNNALWPVVLVGAVSSCLLITRGIAVIHKKLESRPCKFSKLTKDQQEFLIGRVRTGDRFIRHSDRFSSQHWYRELISLKYIGIYDHISRQGWKNVEEYIKKSSAARG